MDPWIAWYIAFTLFLAGLAWYPCCCEFQPGEPCDTCIASTTPDSHSVTISGIDDSDCDCAVINATHLCPQDWTVDYCFYENDWTDIETGVCSSQFKIYARTIQVPPSSDNGYVVILSLVASGGAQSDIRYIWDSGDTALIHCHTERAPAYYDKTDSLGGNTACQSFSTATVTVL